MSKGEFQGVLWKIWESLGEDAQGEMLRAFGLGTAGESLEEVLAADAGPLLSPLDVFHRSMVEGKFDKSFWNESLIDRKLARLQYEQLLQRSRATLAQRKSAKQQMRVELEEVSGAEQDSRSCSTYDSNFEEAGDTEEEPSTLRNLILRHKEALRNPVSQKASGSSGAVSKVR